MLEWMYYIILFDDKKLSYCVPLMSGDHKLSLKLFMDGKPTRMRVQDACSRMRVP